MKLYQPAALVVALAMIGPAFAHHAFNAEFDASAPVSLSGTVTKVDWAEPHVVIHLAVADAGGQTRNWNFEAAGPSAMQKKGWQKDMIKEGQKITVKGYRAKSEPFVAAARMITLSEGKSMSSADDQDGGPAN